VYFCLKFGVPWPGVEVSLGVDVDVGVWPGMTSRHQGWARYEDLEQCAMEHERAELISVLVDQSPVDDELLIAHRLLAARGHW
jgi:hypothetical protein